jgi:multicomponent Na+:H+ antiporter subunit A
MELGGLRSAMPWTMAGAVATGLSMAGLPPLFGFIGKEMTYEAALHADSWGWALLGAGVLANVALVGSGLVVGLNPFIGERTGALTREPHEAPVSMWLGPLVLGGLGLAFGVYPALIDHTLLQSAQTGILQQSHELHLALWHGFSPALMASLVTFALGFTVYATWTSLQPSAVMRGLGAAFGDGPGRVFERSLYGLARASHAVTQALQNGRFRRYLLATFLAIIVFVGGGVLFGADLAWPTVAGTVEYYEVALAGLIVLSALVAVRTQGRFVAILALSVGGYGVALLYLLFGAPDLAMTQFAIETLTLILLVIVVVHLPGIEGEEAVGIRLRDGAVALGCGALYTVLMSLIVDIPLNRRVSEYLAENSYTEAQGHNIVNVILVDFRGIDTMGEITVLTIAALGVYVLMRMPRRSARADAPTHREEAPEEAGADTPAPADAHSS